MEMLKKGFAALLLAGFAACMPMQALAFAAQYSTTQSFLDAMDAEGIRYTWIGVDNDGDEKVEVSYIGDNMPVIRTNWYFNQNLDRVSIRVWDVIKYDGSAIDQLYPALNQVNSDYRFVCFYADDNDDTVTAKVDAEIREDNAGSVCYKLLLKVVDIVDASYPTLAQYDINAIIEVPNSTSSSTDTESTGVPEDDNNPETRVISDSIEYGSLTGNVTYYYNNFRGNVPDVDSVVIAFPYDWTLDIEFSAWTIPSIINTELNNKGIYATKVDGTGSYTISNLPAGEYWIFILSENTTTEQWFSAQDEYQSTLRQLIQDTIGKQNVSTFLTMVGANKYVMEKVSIKGNCSTVYSHDFGMTYI